MIKMIFKIIFVYFFIIFFVKKSMENGIYNYYKIANIIYYLFEK